jgi:hypothetical protein
LSSSTLHRDGQIERLDEQRRQLVLSHERYVEELTADFERKLDEERQSRLQLEVRRGLLLYADGPVRCTWWCAVYAMHDRTSPVLFVAPALRFAPFF